MKKSKIIVIVLGILIIVIAGYFIIKNYQNRNISDNYKTLTEEKIKSELLKLSKINEPPNNKAIDRNDYPKIIGIDKRNGKILKEMYDCRDLCPDYAMVVLIYDDVNSENECLEINGIPISPWPFEGEFEWCEPKIIQNLPIQGIPGVSKADETKISGVISNRFFSYPLLGNEVSIKCNNLNTKIYLLVSTIEEERGEDRISAKVECYCGTGCGYDITYNLKKVNNEWIIDSESKMSLV